MSDTCTKYTRGEWGTAGMTASEMRCLLRCQGIRPAVRRAQLEKQIRERGLVSEYKTYYPNPVYRGDPGIFLRPRARKPVQPHTPASKISMVCVSRPASSVPVDPEPPLPRPKCTASLCKAFDALASSQ